VLALLIIVYSIPVFLLRKSHAAVICVATAGTLATGFVCFNVVVAAGWSVLHGGLSEGAFYVLYAVVVVAPPALGFLAGVATRHRLGRRVPPDQTGRSYSTCPDCGCSMRRLADDSATPHVCGGRVPHPRAVLLQRQYAADAWAAAARLAATRLTSSNDGTGVWYVPNGAALLGLTKIRWILPIAA